jgi:hypothetical protein
MARTVAPSDSETSSSQDTSTPEDRRLEVIYSSVVLLVVAFAFWTFPVSIDSRMSLVAILRLYQVVRVLINPLKVKKRLRLGKYFSKCSAS